MSNAAPFSKQGLNRILKALFWSCKLSARTSCKSLKHRIKMDKEELKEYREYAWKYFSLHAEQRLKTFHFFIVLSAIISGAILTIYKDIDNVSYVAPMLYLLSFLTFIFWKLDQRNKELIKRGESALKAIENNIELTDDKMKTVCLFSSEATKTATKKRFPNVSIFKAHFSYTNCFNWVFFAFGMGSFVFGTLLLIFDI